MGVEETEGACMWHKEHMPRLGTGVNQAGGGESDEFEMGIWLLGDGGVGLRRKRP